VRDDVSDCDRDVRGFSQRLGEADHERIALRDGERQRRIGTVQCDPDTARISLRRYVKRQRALVGVGLLYPQRRRRLKLGRSDDPRREGEQCSYAREHTNNRSNHRHVPPHQHHLLPTSARAQRPSPADPDPAVHCVCGARRKRRVGRRRSRARRGRPDAHRAERRTRAARNPPR
jgi:hypothetical protein